MHVLAATLSNAQYVRIKRRINSVRGVFYFHPVAVVFFRVRPARRSLAGYRVPRSQHSSNAEASAYQLINVQCSTLRTIERLDGV